MARLEFFFDFTCPYAFLASTQVEELAERCAADLHWRPMFLGGVFRALYGEASIPTPPAVKLERIKRDLQRWAQHWDAPFSYPQAHPNNSAAALRCVLAAPEHAAAISHRVFRAYWQEHADISDRKVLYSLLEDAGCDAHAVFEASQSDMLRKSLRDDTDEAIERGVFGAPTFFVERDHMIWGQDRLLFVEKMLGGWRPEGVDRA